MIEDTGNPAEIAQKRRQEAIDRINKDIQSGSAGSSIADPQNAADGGLISPQMADGAPGYITPDGTYVPNRIAFKTRIANGLLSLGIIAYGYWGLQRDDLAVPISKRTASHFHGVSAWITYAAMLCASAHLVAIVIDHYDRRNNEHHYQRFGELSKAIGWGLFAVAIIMGFARHQIDFR